MQDWPFSAIYFILVEWRCPGVTTKHCNLIRFPRTHIGTLCLCAHTHSHTHTLHNWLRCPLFQCFTFDPSCWLVKHTVGACIPSVGTHMLTHTHTHTHIQILSFTQTESLSQLHSLPTLMIAGLVTRLIMCVWERERERERESVGDPIWRDNTEASVWWSSQRGWQGYLDNRVILYFHSRVRISSE